MSTSTIYVQPNFAQLIEELYTLICKMEKVNLQDRNGLPPLFENCDRLSKLYKMASKTFEEKSDELSLLSEAMSLKLQIFSENMKEEMQQKMDRMSKKNRLLWKDLAISYEELISKTATYDKMLEAKKNFKHIIPQNYYRNIFHMVNGLIVVSIYLFFVTKAQALSILIPLMIAAIITEITRKISPKFNDFCVDVIFGKVSRPKERFQVNSATYYLVAVTTMLALLPQFSFCVGALVLGFGDPLANIIGKKFGKTKIYNEKSLEGTLAFFVTSFVIIVTFALLNTPLAIVDLLILAFGTSFVGAVVELYSNKLDDNLTIIVSSSLTCQLLFTLAH